MLKIKIDNIDKNILTIPYLITCMFLSLVVFIFTKQKQYHDMHKIGIIKNYKELYEKNL